MLGREFFKFYPFAGGDVAAEHAGLRGLGAGVFV